MNPARWEQIQAVFHQAITLSQSEQAVFLTTSCNGDGAMLRELSRMMEENSRGDSILDRGLPDVAYRMIGSPFASLAGSEIGVYRLLRHVTRPPFALHARNQNARQAVTSLHCSSVRCRRSCGWNPLVCYGVCPGQGLS